MAKGSFNLAPVITRWWQQDGRRRPTPYLVLPVVTGVSVLLFGLRVDNLDALLTGAMFLAGLLFTTLFQVHDWSAASASALDEVEGGPIGAGWERERHHRRLQAVGRLYDSLTWATLVSLALSVALILLNTEATDAQEQRDLVYTTAIVGVIGTHLLVVLLAVLNRLFIVTRSNVDRHREHADT